MNNAFEDLGRALRSIYGSEGALPGQHRLRRPQCPSLPRFATALAKGFTSQEYQHMASCTYCKMLLAMENPEKLREVMAAALANMWIVLKAVQLRRRGMAAAAVGGEVNITEVSADGRLESTFIEDDNQLVLVVRTKERALDRQLVKYTITAADGGVARTGFLVLQPDVNDWYAAHDEFNADELGEQVQGVCQTVKVQPVDTSMLTAGDREALLDSVKRADETAPGAWKAWLEGVEQDNIWLGEEVDALLTEIRSVLQA